MRKSAVVLLFAAGLPAACATSRATVRLGDGVVVHTFRRAYANAHLVVQGRNQFLVDAGHERNARLLERDLRDAGFDPARLRAIVLTHGHADHAGGALHFQRAFGTRVVAGAGDAPLLASGKNDRLCPTGSRARDRLAEDQAATYSPTRADVLVSEPLDLAALTGVAGRIVPVPGHTAGSLAVVTHGAALVGDLFRGAIVGSSAELHFYLCDVEKNRADIAALLAGPARAAATFFTGHFGPVSRAAVEARFGGPRQRGGGVANTYGRESTKRQAPPSRRSSAARWTVRTTRPSAP